MFENPFKSLNPIIDHNVKIVDNNKFQRFLRSYVRENKKKKFPSQSTKKFVKKLPPPNPHPISIPTHKQHKPSNHPMTLRRRKINTPYQGNNFRNIAVQHVAQEQSSLSLYHIYNEAGVKQHVDKLLKQDPKTWEPSVSNELGRLTKGIRDIQGNDVFDFIAKHEVPPYKKVTYANLVCDYRPSKDDPYITRLTVEGG